MNRRLLVGQSVGLSLRHVVPKMVGKLDFHAPIGALVLSL